MVFHGWENWDQSVGFGLMADAVGATDLIIKTKGLTMKAKYKFMMKGWAIGGLGPQLEESVFEPIFQGLVQVDVVWDKNGVRIEGLPDVTTREWFKDP